MTRAEQIDMYWQEFICGTKNECPNLMLNNKVPPEKANAWIEENYSVYLELRKEGEGQPAIEVPKYEATKDDIAWNKYFYG